MECWEAEMVSKTIFGKMVRDSNVKVYKENIIG